MPRVRDTRLIYCVVPFELAAKLHEPLRQFFRDDPRVEVVVDRRKRERRRGARRAAGGAAPGAERRAVRAGQGRRIAHRRAATVPVAPLPLPRRARRYADRLAFVERVEPSDQHARDVDSARLVVGFQAGDGAAFRDLYLRYFDAIYSYLSVALGDHHDAEDAAQQVFTKALEALPRYEVRPGKPFRAWLFRIARNEALATLRRKRLIELEDPDRIDRRREAGGAAADDLALEWLSDTDLVVLIERLPDAQRQVLALRYMLDLSRAEIAAVMQRTPAAVSQLEQRALRFLSDRLTALGRGPLRPHRPPMLIRLRRMPVLGARRSALGGR